jgi:hypothetical protein
VRSSDPQGHISARIRQTTVAIAVKAKKPTSHLRRREDWRVFAVTAVMRASDLFRTDCAKNKPYCISERSQELPPAALVRRNLAFLILQ